MTSGRRGSGLAAAALAALLDRSIEQIGAAAADARSFDRQAIVRTSDVWDNNTFPLFRALLARTRAGRERRARAALAWMADLGPARRAWVTEQAAAAGYDVTAFLSSDAPDIDRDFRGRPIAPVAALTPAVAGALAADYDLTTARVRVLEVERTSPGRTGTLILRADRRFPVEDGSAAPAELRLQLPEVTDVRLDSRDASGITLSVDASEVVIGVGARGTLRGPSGEVYCDDVHWYLSSAGRAADAALPRRTVRSRPSRSPRSHLRGPALLAASLLREAMFEIRAVRFPEIADQVPIPALCCTFAGTGATMLRLPATGRAAVFGELIDAWIERGGPMLAGWFGASLREFGGTRQIPTALIDSIPPTPDPAPPDLPAQARLHLVRYAAAHRFNPAQGPEAIVLLASPPRPPDDVSRLRARTIDDVERFQVHTSAFDGFGDLRAEPGTLSVHGDALSISHAATAM